MPALAIRYRVTDVATTTLALDRDRDARAAYGEKESSIFQNAVDPHDILILFAWDDRERARFYAQSDDLLHVLTEAGMVGTPDVWILNSSGG